MLRTCLLILHDYWQVCANVPVVNDYPNCWPHMAYAKLLLTQDNYVKVHINRKRAR